MEQINSPIIISDELVDHLADRYIDDRLLDCGVPFAVYFDSAISGYPSLPWFDASAIIKREIVPELQAIVEFLGTDEVEPHALQVELENNASITCRNGRYIEPLHHHAFPRRRASRYTPGVLS